MKCWMIVSLIVSLLGACVVTPVGYRYYDDGYRGGYHRHDRDRYGYYHDHAK